MYKTSVALFKRDLNRGITVTLQYVKSDLRQIYASSKPSANKVETLLAGFPKKPKGDCHICGKKGHKAEKCWDNTRNKDKRPSFYMAPTDSKTETAMVTNTKLHCDYCNKDNHTVDRCFKKQKDDKAKGKTDTTNFAKTEIIMICISKQQKEYLMYHSNGKIKFTDNTFIADSGATSHMLYSKEGMYNLQPHAMEITVGNSEIMYSSEIGTYKGTTLQQDGTYIDIVLHDVLYVPELWVN